MHSRLGGETHNKISVSYFSYKNQFIGCYDYTMISFSGIDTSTVSDFERKVKNHYCKMPLNDYILTIPQANSCFDHNGHNNPAHWMQSYLTCPVGSLHEPKIDIFAAIYTQIPAVDRNTPLYRIIFDALTNIQVGLPVAQRSGQHVHNHVDALIVGRKLFSIHYRLPRNWNLRRILNNPQLNNRTPVLVAFCDSMWNWHKENGAPKDNMTRGAGSHFWEQLQKPSRCSQQVHSLSHCLYFCPRTQSDMVRSR